MIGQFGKKIDRIVRSSEIANDLDTHTEILPPFVLRCPLPVSSGARRIDPICMYFISVAWVCGLLSK